MLKKNNIFCFLSMVVGVFVWVGLLALLFDPVRKWPPNEIHMMIYSAAAGATPLAAFPGIVLFSGNRKPSRNAQ